MRGNNEVKVDLDYRKKELKEWKEWGSKIGVCTMSVMATIVDMQEISSGVDFHALDLFRGRFSCRRSPQGLLFMQEIS